MRLLAGAFIGLALAPPPSGPQEVPCPPVRQRQQLESHLQTILQDFVTSNRRTPSALLHLEAPSLCVSWSGVAGSELLDGNRLLQANRTFRIASNTKTYTAAAILRLEEEGHLSVADPVARHLSAEQSELLKQGGYDPEAITVLHLLTHTSGLFDHGASDNYIRAILANPKREWRREEQLRIAVYDGRPLGPPGGQFSYSDTGYVLLGGIVESKTGLSLAAAFRSLLDFEELRLGETWTEKLEPRPATAASRTHQYFGELDTWAWDPSMDLWGGGGVVTSARDLAAFIRALFEGRVFDDPATFHKMRETQPVSNRMDYRIGLFGLTVDGRQGLGHTGFWNTFAFHFPDIDVTVAGSVNQQQAEPGSRLAARAVRAILAALPEQR